MEWEKRYGGICRELGIDPEKDEEATAVLGSILPEQDIGALEGLIRGKTIIVFGCGPSLEKDITNIGTIGGKSTLIAADGAVEALLGRGIVPHVNVTDLDGDAKSIIRANGLGTVTVVHAHGDNIPKLREMVPKLEGAVIGTTQATPTEKVKNFGGFTDGDRAVFLAVHFGAEKILLAGMDFGTEIGWYSGPCDSEKKPIKLRIGKELIEELASEMRVKIRNVTSAGEELRGIPRVPIGK